MSLPRHHRAFAVALSLGATLQTHAAFQAVDTFNGRSDGAIGGQNGWVVTAGDTTTSTVVADPDNASNKVLRHAGVADAYKLLPAAIADTSGGTLFYRLRIGGLTNDVSFGLSDANPPSLTDFGTYEVQSNVTNTDGRFGTRDGASGNQTSLLVGTSTTGQLLTLTANVWYNVWVVADTTADTFRVYMQRDGDALLGTQVEIRPSDGTFNFRNPVAANPLQAFVILSNSGATNIYLDDIFADTSVTANLENPALTFNPDADEDGLEDAWEIGFFGNTAAQNGSGNPDGDSATNEEEETAGSDPTNSASTLIDTDADGLLDSWEVTHFGNKAAETGAGDYDGDSVTNEQEETAVTNPANAAEWPNTDGDGLNDAWEILHFGNLGQTGSGDFDSDTFTNFQEQAAGSDPKNANWTPTKAVLVHRWSFNGNLLDSIGTSHATIVDPDANAAVGGTVTQGASDVILAGGVSTTSAAVRLGGNLVGGRSTPVTVELWATPNAIQFWSRIFDFGSSTSEYLFMSWVQGTNPAQDQVAWVDGTLGAGLPNTNAPYTLGQQYHVVLTLTPAAYTNGALAIGTRVTWYTVPANSTTTVVAKGSFDTALNLAKLNDLNNWIGRSMYAADNVASATYDEVRIWNGALTASAVNTHQIAGPNAFAVVDTDSDGLSDAWEQTFFGGLSENGSGDYDHDGSTNAQEYAAGSDPIDPASTHNDTDADGLSDSWEIQHFANLAQTAEGDPDGDLATNLYEQQAGGNPNSGSSPDNDIDFMNDGWELAHFGNLNAKRNEDPDDDGYDNGFEFENGFNPNDDLSSPDSDGDGLADGWEVHYFKLTGETGLADLGTIIARQDGAGDPDGDLFSNVLEYFFLSDPSLATSVPGDLDNDGDNDGPMLKLGDVLGATSFDTALNWHDGLVPVAGKTYIVSINGLRTPATGSPTFAGDKLVLTTSGTNVGTLIWKTDGAVTIPVLQLDGGLVNQAATNNSTVTLNGTIVVSKNSTLFANNGSFLINSSISGGSDLTLSGGGSGGSVSFASGTNTWTGNLIVPAATANAANNRFTLAATGNLRFTPGAASVVNTITGAGVITLNGTFNIDLSAASQTLGASWTLVGTTGAKTYGAGFTVAGFSADTAAAGSRKWTSGIYTYDEATGVLSVTGSSLSALQNWRVTYFGSSANSGNGADAIDYDADGRANLLEYALGTDPTVANSGAPATVATAGGVLTLSFDHIGDATLNYVVEGSNDLVTWTMAQTYTGLTSVGTTTYIDNVPLGAGTRRFLRLKITAP